MHATQFVRLFLGPSLSLAAVSVASAGSIHGQDDATPLLVAVALIVMLSLSAGAVVFTRWQQRRWAKRDAQQQHDKRCDCCGISMRGIVDAQSGPVWRCVECMRQESALYSLRSL